VIHPALLVHDTRLNAPVYGTFLDADFRALLGTVPPGKRVMPLTVMTIADLENLESSVDQFSMRQLLTDYAAPHPDGLVSLHNFMACNPTLRGQAQAEHAAHEEFRTPDSAGASRALSRLAKPGPGRGACAARTRGLTLECRTLMEEWTPVLALPGHEGHTGVPLCGDRGADGFARREAARLAPQADDLSVEVFGAVP
jgi:hypothetical protein